MPATKKEMIEDDALRASLKAIGISMRDPENYQLMKAANDLILAYELIKATNRA